MPQVGLDVVSRQRVYPDFRIEIDEQSVQCAMVNVRANSMQHRIEVIRVSPNDSIFPDTVFM